MRRRSDATSSSATTHQGTGTRGTPQCQDDVRESTQQADAASRWGTVLLRHRALCFLRHRSAQCVASDLPWLGSEFWVLKHELGIGKHTGAFRQKPEGAATQHFQELVYGRFRPYHLDGWACILLDFTLRPGPRLF